MKKIIIVAVVFLCCISVSFAHPGRTDSNGGHYNRSTGEYHYHHGYPEHQHVNNTCPYDFDDRTGERSGSSTSSSREPPTISTRKVPTISTGNSTQTKTSSGGIAKKIFLYVIACTVGIYVCYKIIVKCARIHEEKVFVRNRGSVKFADQLRPQLQEIKQHRLELQQREYFSPREACGVPNGAFLNDELLPCTGDQPLPFGKYTVFYNFNSKKFHFTHCIYASHGIKANILDVPIYAKPCYKCLRSGPPLDWIAPYVEYTDAFKIIGIDPDENRP